MSRTLKQVVREQLERQYEGKELLAEGYPDIYPNARNVHVVFEVARQTVKIIDDIFLATSVDYDTEVLQKEWEDQEVSSTLFDHVIDHVMRYHQNGGEIEVGYMIDYLAEAYHSGDIVNELGPKGGSLSNESAFSILRHALWSYITYSHDQKQYGALEGETHLKGRKITLG